MRWYEPWGGGEVRAGSIRVAFNFPTCFSDIYIPLSGTWRVWLLSRSDDCPYSYVRRKAMRSESCRPKRFVDKTKRSDGRDGTGEEIRVVPLEPGSCLLASTTAEHPDWRYYGKARKAKGKGPNNSSRLPRYRCEAFADRLQCVHGRSGRGVIPSAPRTNHVLLYPRLLLHTDVSIVPNIDSSQVGSGSAQGGYDEVHAAVAARGQTAN